MKKIMEIKRTSSLDNNRTQEIMINSIMVMGVRLVGVPFITGTFNFGDDRFEKDLNTKLEELSVASAVDKANELREILGTKNFVALDYGKMEIVEFDLEYNAGDTYDVKFDKETNKFYLEKKEVVEEKVDNKDKDEKKEKEEK